MKITLAHHQHTMYNTHTQTERRDKMTDNEALYQLKVKQLNLSQLENEALITNNYLALRALELYDDLEDELHESLAKIENLEEELYAGDDL